MNKQEMLARFQTPEEKLLFSKVLDRLFLCIQNGENTFTDFMDPVKVGCFMTVIKRHALPRHVCESFGGRPDCERRMIGFSVEDSLSDADFPIIAIEIRYNPKFSRTLMHRDFLGSLLGLGIIREKVGDIFLEEGRGVVFVSREIADYICVSLKKVANTTVRTGKIESGQIELVENNKQERRVTVSSMRIDNVISSTFNLSRKKAAELISAEKVFVNWSPVTESAKAVKEKDMITVRGMGRVQVDEIAGRTKKGRLILRIILY